MKDVTAEVRPAVHARYSATGRRLLRLLRWHGHQQLGWPGVAGVAALALALGLARPLADLAAEAVQAEAEAAAVPVADAPGPVTVEPRVAWLADMPDTRQRTAQITRLIGAAESAGLTIGATDYSLDVPASGLVRLRVSLPVAGSYAQVRRHIGRVLGQSPYAGLDSLQIERPTGDRPGLQATVRWSLYFREPAR
jgi:hypothetical protein